MLGFDYGIHAYPHDTHTGGYLGLLNLSNSSMEDCNIACVYLQDNTAGGSTSIVAYYNITGCELWAYTGVAIKTQTTVVANVGNITITGNTFPLANVILLNLAYGVSIVANNFIGSGSSTNAIQVTVGCVSVSIGINTYYGFTEGSEVSGSFSTFASVLPGYLTLRTPATGASTYSALVLQRGANKKIQIMNYGISFNSYVDFSGDLYFRNAPDTGSVVMTLTNGGNWSVTGSKTFKITHPLDDNKWLYHASIEGPRMDLVYRGRVDLVDGSAVVDIDKASNMSPGTFTALTQNPSGFFQNNSGWSSVKGEVIGGEVHITANASCSDNVTWMVIAERVDASTRQSSLTDINGHFVPEHTKTDNDTAATQTLSAVKPAVVITPHDMSGRFQRAESRIKAE